MVARRQNPWKWVMVFAIVVCAAVYVVRDAYPNPAFNIALLKGMTPDEIVKKFGPPSDDPRAPSPGGSPSDVWTPARESQLGPLTLLYQDSHSFMDYKYNIVFQDGKVSVVFVDHK
jgi:hypothetical protein